ncbi:MAG: adenylate/guanylate cyclase domain-containing protein, partial [Chloroflexota bacterium]
PNLLLGIKSGLFDLNWDIHCPHCNMITDQHHNLANASDIYYCKMCEREFESDFSDRVEVTFSLNKQIEDLNMPPICPPPPSVNPRFQMSIPKNQTTTVEETLEPGIYKYNCPVTQSTGTLLVEGEPSDEPQNFHLKQLAGEQFDHTNLRARPGKISLSVTNEGYPISGLWVAERDLPLLSLSDLPVRLSGLDLIHYPEFNEIFGNQVLSERERIKISSVTTIFTDITGSTQMYETLGDTAAYNIVRDHFDILFEAIQHCGGTVLKTIGDAVMASFTSNDRALKSIADALAQFKAYNQGRSCEQQVKIKVGIHRGSAILVNLNGRLDYFGSTINKAARIQHATSSNEIAFSEEVFNDTAFQNVLMEIGPQQVARESINLKGLEGNHVVYKAII